jgi:uncharacterized protein YggU (UPF0235/DUF167 family)
MATIAVRARPGSRREAIQWDGWRNCWTAACRELPRQGQANDALLELFSRQLAVPVGRLRWVHGTRSREKLLEVEGLSEDEVARRLRRPGVPGAPGERRRASP